MLSAHALKKVKDEKVALFQQINAFLTKCQTITIQLAFQAAFHPFIPQAESQMPEFLETKIADLKPLVEKKQAPQEMQTDIEKLSKSLGLIVEKDTTIQTLINEAQKQQTSLLADLKRLMSDAEYKALIPKPAGHDMLDFLAPPSSAPAKKA